MVNKELEMAKEIVKIAQENNVSVQELIEQYKKVHNSTDQSKSYEHMKFDRGIISNLEDIDNGYTYNLETGQTIGEL